MVSLIHPESVALFPKPNTEWWQSWSQTINELPPNVDFSLTSCGNSAVTSVLLTFLFLKHSKGAASHLESAQEQQPKAAGDLLTLLRRERADTLYHGKVQELHRRTEETASTQLRRLLSALPAGLTHLQLLKDPLTSWLSPVQHRCPSAGATGHTDSERASS